jgi:hypothetical protein
MTRTLSRQRLRSGGQLADCRPTTAGQAAAPTILKPYLHNAWPGVDAGARTAGRFGFLALSGAVVLLAPARQHWGG